MGMVSISRLVRVRRLIFRIGNPIGGLVFSSAFGDLQQIHEWTNFMAADQFCFRACNPAGADAPGWCKYSYAKASTQRLTGF